MNLNFKEDGGILVTLNNKRFKDLETNINGFFDNGGMDKQYNHHDLFDILKQHGIDIINGENNDKGSGRSKKEVRA